jgi:hypothetical protein
MIPAILSRLWQAGLASGTWLAHSPWEAMSGVLLGNPITGHQLRWTFQDGPMAGKSFDHTFNRNGGVTFREVGSDPNAKPGSAEQYLVASLGQDVHTVSYLSPSGYTLTVVLDYKSRKLVAYASNGESLVMQRGTFETL